MNLRQSLTAKIISIILFIALCAVFVVSTAGIIFFTVCGAYENPEESFFKTDIVKRYASTEANRAFYNHFYHYNTAFTDESNDSGNTISEVSEITSQDRKDMLNYFKSSYSLSNTNFAFTVKDGSGNIIADTYLSSSYSDFIYISNFHFSDYHNQTVIVETYIRSRLAVKDELYYANMFYSRFLPQRNNLVYYSVTSFILSFLLIIFLMCSAGHKKGKDGITLNALDKIPLDLYLLVSDGLILAFAASVVTLAYYVPYLLALCFIPFALAALVFISTFMTFAARIKYGKWWRNTIIYRIISLIKKPFVWAYQTIREVYDNFSILKKALAIFGIISFVELIILLAGADFGVIFLWFIEKLVLGAIMCLIIIELQKIKTGAKKISSGDLQYKIETSQMHGELKKHAQNLNRINEGLTKAVDERMKSERFKAELITNVSHDIKTPLTSIINYVDLLKKEKIENETANEYIEVLDRQSRRLKKMTEDLVEASKASTGNISVNFEKTNINELLAQAVGEYDERLHNAGVEPVLTLPDKDIFVNIDGRLLWRVFDNLLGNICKYSMPGTRAYFSLAEKELTSQITFKNISKYPLNIASDELLERFVRGDSSRSTEGSGLGLSIAKSLTELQKGSLSLFVDGDLFKIVINFDKLI